MSVAFDTLALVVEGDEERARITAAILDGAGVSVTAARDGDEAVRRVRSGPFDVVVLAMACPRGDGLGVCTAIRTTSSVPILAVGGHGDADVVLSLELGADDCLGERFSPRELVARVRALVRRARGLVGPSNRVLLAGPLELDLGSMSARYSGRAVDLTTYEFAILRVLAERRGRVLSREQILELARGTADEAFDRSIDVRISRIRRKLGEERHGTTILQTVRGAGYRLACA